MTLSKNLVKNCDGYMATGVIDVDNLNQKLFISILLRLSESSFYAPMPVKTRLPGGNLIMSERNIKL